MIPTKIVREKTGLTQHQLWRLRKLRLIPKPTRIPAIGRRGSTYALPDTIFTRIHLIRFLQGHGFTLIQVAQAARGTPFECLPPGPSPDPKLAP
ncbi:hypothetical protein ES708_14023 [subsurface metagenome]